MNQAGICHLSVAPIRSGPSHKEEMVNQMLFGETYEIKETSEDWVFIKTLHDDYHGWVDIKQVHLISENTFQKIQALSQLHTTELVQLIFNHEKKCFIPILMGSVIPYLNGKVFYIDDTQYTYEGDTIGVRKNVSAEGIIETSKMYLNTPYLWGGRSPFGIDCSGLVQMIFKINGIQLKRDAHDQAQQGETISFISDAKAGDVAFFDNAEGQIVHTGIITGKGTILHASGSVRYDSIDHYGIFNYNENKYTHKLRLIKRYLHEKS